MKRCVFCFAGLLATIALAITLEWNSTDPSAASAMDSDEGRHMALQAEAVPQDLTSPGIQSEKTPETSP